MSHNYFYLLVIIFICFLIFINTIFSELILSYSSIIITIMSQNYFYLFAVEFPVSKAEFHLSKVRQ